MPGPFPTKSVVLIPSDGADGLTPQAEAVRVSLPQGAVAKSWGTDASGAAVQGEPIDSVARGLAVRADQNPARSGAYLGQVGTHCYSHNRFFSGHKQSMCRTSMIARDAISRPRVVLSNWYVDVDFVEKGTGANAIVTGSIEYPVGVFTPATWSGSASGTVPDGYNLVSDEVPISIPKGATFWVRSWFSSTGGVPFTENSFIKDNATLGDGFVWNVATPDLTRGGVVAGHSTNWAPPVAVLAYTKMPSFLYLGDSRTLGQGEIIGVSGVSGLLKCISASYGHINASRGGDYASNIVTKGAKRFSLGSWVSDIVVPLGTNDLLGGATGAAVIANVTAIGTALRAAYPSARLWLPTIPPLTVADNSTTNVTANPNRIAFNNLARACPNPFDGVLELADPIEGDGASLIRNGGRFSSAAYTSDGVHLNPAGNDAITASGLVPAGMFLPR